MQLSLLLPTHRSDFKALSRIAQASSCATPEIQVLVRDNSGDVLKRRQIELLQSEHCRIIAAEPCSPVDNVAELVGLAEGDFIFLLADDDMVFERTIADLPTMIDNFCRAPNVIGLTGLYIMEGAHATAAVQYSNLGADDAVTRLTGYLSTSCANVLYYSPHRREMVKNVFEFMRSMPMFFSFHDQITSMLYLLNGKYQPVPRIIYGYDIGPWATPEGGQKVDAAFYKNAGLDPAINKLHWLLCGFEGAVLIRNSQLFPNFPMTKRQAMADLWFSVMFKRFLEGARMTFDSPHTAKAETLCQKLRTSHGQLSFERILADIVGFMALFSPALADRYSGFWSFQMNRTHSVGPHGLDQSKTKNYA